MKQTEVLQEIRKMRFEEVYELRTEKRLTMEQAARMLGINERSFRRYSRRYEEEGMEGLLTRLMKRALFRIFMLTK